MDDLMHFGKNLIFLIISKIRPNVSFARKIQRYSPLHSAIQALEACKVLERCYLPFPRFRVCNFTPRKSSDTNIKYL